MNHFGRTEILLLLMGYINSEMQLRRDVSLAMKHIQFYLTHGANAFSRAHLLGHFTVSTFIVDPNWNRCLLHWHEKLQKWLQFGGHLEPEDPTLIQAALRETKEETCLDLSPIDFQKTIQLSQGIYSEIFDLDIHEIPENKKEPAHTHYDLRLLCVADSTIELPYKNMKWVNLDAVFQATKETSIIRMAQRALDLINAKPTQQKNSVHNTLNMNDSIHSF